MAPKGKSLSSDEEEDRVTLKTIVFGKSQMTLKSIIMLKDKRLVISTRDPGSKVIPKPKDNEVVIF